MVGNADDVYAAASLDLVEDFVNSRHAVAE